MDHKLITSRQTQRRGQVLPLFLTIMVMALLFGSTLLALTANTNRTATSISRSRAAHYLAETGIEKGFAAFTADNNYTGETLLLDTGTVTIVVEPGDTASEKFIVATGTSQTVSRQLRVKLTVDSNSETIGFRFALQAGTNGFSIGNNSQITGNVYSNQNITGSSNSVITGDASAVGTITNVTVNGTSQTGVPAEPLPTFDAAFWKSKAQEGTIIPGSYVPTNNTTLDATYIGGSMSVPSNYTIIIKGPVYVAGAVSFGNDVKLIVDDSLGENGAVFASDGPISFGNKPVVTANSQGGRLLIVSNYSVGNVIDVGNNGTAVAAIFLAPNGNIKIGNSASAVSFAGKGIITGTGAVVEYDEGLASATFSSGPGGGWIMQKGSLQEL